MRLGVLPDWQGLELYCSRYRCLLHRGKSTCIDIRVEHYLQVAQPLNCVKGLDKPLRYRSYIYSLYP